MKIVQLFFSLSCASTAVLPVLRRYSAVKFNQLMNQNGFENLPEQNLHLSPSLMSEKPEFPDLAFLGRVLPISHCFCEVSYEDPPEKDPKELAAKMALKERLLAHNKLYPVPEPLGDYDPTKNPRFIPKDYERHLTEKGYYSTVAEAIESGSIDLTYIPSDPKLLLKFLRWNADASSRGNNVIKYFEAGTFEKMRQAGLVTPKAFIELLKIGIAGDKNYFLANIIFDHIIVAMLNDIDSDDFKVADWEINREFLWFRYLDYHIPVISIITCGLVPLSAEKEQYIKFYSRYNDIFVDAPLRNWELGTSSCPFINWI